MNKDELVELRQKIIDESLPEIMGDMGSPEEKTGLLLNLIRSGRQDFDLYKQAFESIKDISDKNVKVNSMLDLLSLIDSSIGSIENGES